MQKVELLRTIAGFPFRVSSAYRCPSHNMDVSSTGHNGPHTTGHAVDIKVYGPRAYMLVQYALKIGFAGVGVKQKGSRTSRFIHIDDLANGLRPWIWSY